MRATFSGVEVAVLINKGVHLCGVRGVGDEYVLFQHGETELAPADIHFEYLNRAGGGYDCVGECRLSRNKLSIDLTKKLRGFPEVEGVDVALEIDELSYRKLADGLFVMFVSCANRISAT